MKNIKKVIREKPRVSIFVGVLLATILAYMMHAHIISVLSVTGKASIFVDTLIGGLIADLFLLFGLLGWRLMIVLVTALDIATSTSLQYFIASVFNVVIYSAIFILLYRLIKKIRSK